MPILENARQEAFCQARALGKTQDESYRLAGYKFDAGAASRLSRNVKIADRITELRLPVAIAFEITAEQIARQLDEDRALAYECDNPGAAVAASMGKAKLGGLLVDQASMSVHHTYSSMSEEEIRFEIAALVAEARALKPGVQN